MSEPLTVLLATTWAAAILLAAGQAGAGEPAAPQAPAAPYVPQVAAKDFPPTTDIPLALAKEHPRLVFRPIGQGGRTFDHVRNLYKTDATFKKIFDNSLQARGDHQRPALLAAHWIITGDDTWAEQAIDKLLTQPITSSGGGTYSSQWVFALGYDWLYNHPAMTAEKRAKIEQRICERLASELDLLDKHDMAMWHGRNQAANFAMIAALAIGDLPGQERNFRRAAAHYLVTLKALQFTGGWPEGASYWIYNRAGPYALAADCVITALGGDTIAGLPIRQIMKTIGYWQIYQLGPNNVFEPYGDSQGSLNLEGSETGWWELTTDHFARVSGDPGVMAGADYIRNRAGIAYGKRPYFWNIVMTYDPAVRPRDDYDPARPELWMRKHLPQAMLFGRGSLGVAYFHTRWGDRDETFASFKAGDLLAHHDHYDCGTFTIYRGNAQVPQTGAYTDYTGEHRLGYMIQTVSANSLLILAPGEFSNYLKGNRASSYHALAGGQRVMRPTGFDCVSVEHFKSQLNAGAHLERAEITAFDSVPGQYDYVAADITAAYNSTRWAEPGNAAKVSLVTRQWVYLRPEQAFVIFDRVETTDEKFLPKFVLHSLTKPRTAAEKQIAGTQPDDGILETTDRTIVTEYGRGRLTHRVLLPPAELSRTLKIGGEHYRWYVEEDGDQSNGFNGRNLNKGGRAPRGEVRSGNWRTETEPTVPLKSTRFLNVLLPRLADDNAPLPKVELADVGAGAVGVRVGGRLLVFAADDKPLKDVRLSLPAGGRPMLLDFRD